VVGWERDSGILGGGDRVSFPWDFRCANRVAAEVQSSYMPNVGIARSLEEFYRTLEPNPLLTADEIDAYYARELNQVRGEDKVRRLALDLKRAFSGLHFHAFLYGHVGVGKSTELTRLAAQVAGKFQAVRFSAKQELDPSNAKPFDILILMMIRLAEEAARPIEEGGIGWKPAATTQQEILHWFGEEKAVDAQSSGVGASASAGVGVDAESLWSKVIGVFASIKGEMKFSAERNTEFTEYRLRRLPDLINLLNRFFDECNRELEQRHGRNWLILGEDFEKLLNPALPEELFIKYSGAFSQLRCHFVFTIPVALAYAHRGAGLPFPVYSIPDTPVYTPEHTEDRQGRDAVERLLARRIDLGLFEPGQVERAIVASGGHLRDLFSLLREASDLALLDEPASRVIREVDIEKAIYKLRHEVRLRLGESPYEKTAITWEQKAARLVAIYSGHSGAAIPDPVLYSLLQGRAVQEFNGEGWFGVAPLVVDILKEQDRLPADAPGGSA